MIDFEKKFSDLEQTIKNNQKKIDEPYSLRVYYGINAEGMYRLAFLSSANPPKIESTKLLKIVQGKESENVYWTCFDLTTMNAKRVFFSLCSDLVICIAETKTEGEALAKIKDRFNIWKNMFRRGKTQMTDEKTKGLFGELYFLKTFLIPKYGVDAAIKSWSGPENTSKDFSIGNIWFEVKTVASTQTSVKISSISQLSSQLDGYLIINKIERMSESFDNGECSIQQLIGLIFSQIESETTREKFLEKIVDYGFHPDDETIDYKFEVKSMTNYAVDEKFPRMLEQDIKYQEISKVNYELSINSLENFKGELF